MFGIMIVIMALALMGLFQLYSSVTVNKSMSKLIRSAMYQARSPVFVESPVLPGFGKKSPIVHIASKRGNDSLIALGVHFNFLANSTGTAVTGAEPSDLLDYIEIKKDKLITFQSNGIKGMRELVESIIDDTWTEDTLGTNPSSVTYDAWTVIPVSSRNSSDITFQTKLGTYDQIYNNNIISLPTMDIYAYYSPEEVPEFSILSGSETLTVGTRKLDIQGDILGGFLDTIALLGDGTIVSDHVQFEESNGIGYTGFWADLVEFVDIFYRRTMGAYTLILDVVSSKPFDADDKVKLRVTTGGTIYYALLFKNESTQALNPANISPEEPTNAPRDQPSRINEPGGQPGQAPYKAGGFKGWARDLLV